MPQPFTSYFTCSCVVRTIEPLFGDDDFCDLLPNIYEFHFESVDSMLDYAMFLACRKPYLWIRFFYESGWVQWSDFE